MSEIPILFSADMVRAILEGRKTQTRRPVTVCWKGSARVPPYSPYYVEEDGKLFFQDEYGDFHPMERLCPFGQPGDLLWVRETWQAYVLDRDGEVHDPFGKIPKEIPCCVALAWRADAHDQKGPWRPSIHMPRWASRITLRVKSVRIERVQDITDDDAIAEGIVGDEGYRVPGPYFGDQLLPGDCYANVWQSIYGNWTSNPWVWVVEFERVESEARP